MTPKDKLLLDQISALTKLVRATWLSLLGVCLYSLLTVAVQTDLEILEDTKTLELPIIGSEISPSNFRLVAPVLILMITLYLHVLIARLWRLYAFLPRNLSGLTREDAVEPWIGVTVLPNASHAEIFIALGKLAVSFFIWLLPVVSIAAVGGNYIFPTDFFIAYHSALLAMAIASTIIIWGITKSKLKLIRDNLKRYASVNTAIFYSILIFVVSNYFSMTSKSRLFNVTTWFNIKINISEAKLATLKSDQEFTEYSISRTNFSKNWCALKRKANDCLAVTRNNVNEFDVSQNIRNESNDWEVFRIRQLSVIKPLAFNHFQLKKSIARELFAPLLVVSNLNAPETDFSKSIFEGASFAKADFSNSEFVEVAAQFADLRGAIFRDADLFRSDLSYAGLAKANFAGADISSVDFTRSSLVEPIGRQDKFTKLNGTLAVRTKFRRATFSPNSGQGKVDFSQAFINGSFAVGRLASNEMFLLEGRGVQQYFLPYDDGQNIDSSSFPRLAGQLFEGTAFRFFDLSNANNADFSTSFGDATVQRPDTLDKPCQWQWGILNDQQFFGYWRGWLEQGGIQWPPSKAIGELRIKNVLSLVDRDEQGREISTQFIPKDDILVKDVSALEVFEIAEDHTISACTWPTAN